MLHDADTLYDLPTGATRRRRSFQDHGQEFDRLALWASQGRCDEADDAGEVRYVYLDDRASISVEVDEVDYQWALQWLWNYSVSRGGWKLYARRSTRIKGKPISVFLHVAIMERTGIPRPSPYHLLVDHRDGNSLRCRRSNLRWATRSMNRLNVLGKHPHDLIEG